MQTKKISFNLRKRNSAHRLMMNARQAKAASATPAHPRLRHRSPAPRHAEEKGVLNSAFRLVKKHPLYSVLGASLLGAAAGYFIGSKK